MVNEPSVFELLTFDCMYFIIKIFVKKYCHTMGIRLEIIKYAVTVTPLIYYIYFIFFYKMSVFVNNKYLVPCFSNIQRCQFSFQYLVGLVYYRKVHANQPFLMKTRTCICTKCAERKKVATRSQRMKHRTETTKYIKKSI